MASERGCVTSLHGRHQPLSAIIERFHPAWPGSSRSHENEPQTHNMSHEAPKPKRVAIYTRWSSKRPQLSTGPTDGRDPQVCQAAWSADCDGLFGRGERRREAMSQDVPITPSPADDNPFQPQHVRGANPDEMGEMRGGVCAHVHGASAVFDEQPDGCDPRIREETRASPSSKSIRTKAKVG